MKNQFATESEAIEHLAIIAYCHELDRLNIDYSKDGINNIPKKKWIELWIKGYTECKKKNIDKIYSQEDLINSKIDVYKQYEEITSHARIRIERLNKSLCLYLIAKDLSTGLL